MKQTLTVSDFRDTFNGRTNFSYEALGMLFEYFEDVSPDMELDVIAICCEYAEDTPAQIAESYSIDIDGLDDGETRDKVIEYLDSDFIESTSKGDIVYAQF